MIDLGFTEFFSQQAAAHPELVPARVVSDYGIRVLTWLLDGTEQMSAVRARASRDNPVEGGIAVGDWVLVASPDKVVEKILQRRTSLLRQAAGERAEPQAIAANVDRVFVMTSLEPGGDFNVRRLERYFSAIRTGGAEPVIVLGKCDLAEERAKFEREVAPLESTVVVTSALTGEGVDRVLDLIPVGTTAALVGSSGVGKSALTNALLGRTEQLLGDVRASDRRGRHTTTRRSIFALPNGGLLVDTPGMRELRPWKADEDPFDDVTALAATCRYSDCRHENEPECAVRGAIESERLAAWRKLDAERKRSADRQSTHASVEENRKQRAYKRHRR